MVPIEELSKGLEYWQTNKQCLRSILNMKSSQKNESEITNKDFKDIPISSIKRLDTQNSKSQIYDSQPEKPSASDHQKT